MFSIQEGVPEDGEASPLTSSLSNQHKETESGYSSISRRSASANPFGMKRQDRSFSSRLFPGRALKDNVVIRTLDEALSDDSFLDALTVEDEEKQVLPPVTNYRSRRKDLTQSMIIRKDNNQQERLKLQKKFRVERESLEFQVHEVLIIFVLYFLIAVVAYSWTLEDWSVIDSLYFAVTTFTTVGTGDVYPSHTFSTLFTCVFALSGVTFLGIGLGILGSNLVEAETQAASIAETVIENRVTSLYSLTSTETFDNNPVKTISESECEKTEYSSNNLRIITMVSLIFGLSFLIGRNEGWIFIETFYYCVISMITIGYGDVYPTKESSKAIAIFFIPLATAITGHYISYVANLIIDGRQSFFHKKLLESINHMNIEQLKMLDKNGDKEIQKIDYFEFMLKAMNKIDQNLWQQLSDQFDDLDESKDGIITMEELQNAAARRKGNMKQEIAQYRNLWA